MITLKTWDEANIKNIKEVRTKTMEKNRVVSTDNGTDLEEKWCPRCTKWKPLEEFGRFYDGKQSYCRNCNIKYQSAKREPMDVVIYELTLPHYSDIERESRRLSKVGYSQCWDARLDIHKSDLKVELKKIVPLTKEQLEALKDRKKPRTKHHWFNNFFHLHEIYGEAAYDMLQYNILYKMPDELVQKLGGKNSPKLIAELERLETYYFNKRGDEYIEKHQANPYLAIGNGMEPNTHVSIAEKYLDAEEYKHLPIVSSINNTGEKQYT